MFNSFTYWEKNHLSYSEGKKETDRQRSRERGADIEKRWVLYCIFPTKSSNFRIIVDDHQYEGSVVNGSWWQCF